MLCLLNSSISVQSGSRQLHQSVYTSQAALNSRSLGTEVASALRQWVETCVVSGIFGCARYSQTWSSAASETAV